jgi:large subunit ribosomal protein L19e
MVDVRYQRRMAAEILKCGINRVWIDPDQVDEVAEAVTRGDIRRLISYRVIQVRQKKGVTRGRTRATHIQRLKGRRRGQGSRRGSKYARTPRKRKWIQSIRPLRAELARLRGEGDLDARTYRIYYRKARGAMFKSRAHLIQQLEAAGVISGEVAKKEIELKAKVQEEAPRRVKAAEARAKVLRKAEQAKARDEAKEKAKKKAKKKAEKKPKPEKEED